jgi:hypothetical protein
MPSRLPALRALSISGIVAGLLAAGLIAYLASGPDARDAQVAAMGTQPIPGRAGTATPDVSAAPPPGPPHPALVGFVAHPWAEVRVEGREPFLTPRAEPLELAAGSYEVVFEHPTYGVVRRNVRVRAGEQTVVRHVFPESVRPQ